MIRLFQEGSGSGGTATGANYRPAYCNDDAISEEAIACKIFALKYVLYGTVQAVHGYK